MYAHVEKTKVNRREAVANSVAQRKSDVKQSFGFVNNRPDAIALREMQSFANHHTASQSLQKKEKKTCVSDNPRFGIEGLSRVSIFNKNMVAPVNIAQGKLQTGVNSCATPIQRVISANPIAVDQAGMLAAGGVAMDMGNTDPIAGAVVPTYNIDTNAVNGGFEATVVKTANAFEGDSNAVYLQRGIYPSGLMLNAGNLQQFAAGLGNRQVYADLLTVNSNLSRMAEQEHLDDLRRAFEITLDIADRALDQAVLDGPYGVYATAPLAEFAARTSINNTIAARAVLLGTTAFLITDNLDLLYQNKQNLTQTGRDGPGFHTFDIDRDNESTSALACVMYLLTLLPGVENKDFREVIPGGNFNVPGPASNAVVV